MYKNENLMMAYPLAATAANGNFQSMFVFLIFFQKLKKRTCFLHATVVQHHRTTDNFCVDS